MDKKKKQVCLEEDEAKLKELIRLKYMADWLFSDKKTTIRPLL